MGIFPIEDFFYFAYICFYVNLGLPILCHIPPSLSGFGPSYSIAEILSPSNNTADGIKVYLSADTM